MTQRRAVAKEGRQKGYSPMDERGSPRGEGGTMKGLSFFSQRDWVVWVIGWGRRPGVGGGECGTPAPRGLIKDKIGLKFEVAVLASTIKR